MLTSCQINKLAALAVSSGLIAMKYYNTSYTTIQKSDATPVTEADLAVNSHIVQFLRNHYSDIPVLSEENLPEQNLQALKSSKLFIIDPIDGTEAFIEKRPEFTINIGLVENGEFSLGFIYVPRLDLLYYNDYQNSYKISDASQDGKVEILAKNAINKSRKQLIIATSHRCNEVEVIDNELAAIDLKSQKFIRQEFIRQEFIRQEFIRQEFIRQEFIRFSSSYKFCLLAEKKVDIYMRRAKMKIWDVAAAIAILNLAGCVISDNKNEIIDFTFLKKFQDFSVPYFNAYAADYTKFPSLKP